MANKIPVRTDKDSKKTAKELEKIVNEGDKKLDPFNQRQQDKKKK